MSEIEVILGNSNPRFSGVTSTMLATLPGVAEKMNVAILGAHYIPEGYRVLSFREFVKLCRKPMASGKWRVFHARRNDEMIQALLAKWIFGAKIKILFTSTAQRKHSTFTKWLMKQMDGIISTCKAAASYLESPPDIIIPHGVDTEEFKPADDRDALWKSMRHGGQFGIGMFGRIRPSKGTDLLVRAAIPILKKDSRPTVVIIGETTPKFQKFKDDLQREVDEAGLSDRILFLGKLPFEEVKRYFQAVSLVTALSRNEGFGLTVLEAMASGAAVIASDAGAWGEILDDVVTCGIAGEVASTLEEVLASNYGLAGNGVLNRQRAEDTHNVKKETQRLIAYYNNVF